MTTTSARASQKLPLLAAVSRRPPNPSKRAKRGSSQNPFRASEKSAPYRRVLTLHVPDREPHFAAIAARGLNCSCIVVSRRQDARLFFVDGRHVADGHRAPLWLLDFGWAPKAKRQCDSGATGRGIFDLAENAAILSFFAKRPRLNQARGASKLRCPTANSDAFRPPIPISFRPPFRFEAGHLSRSRRSALAPRGSSTAAILTRR